ncbi:MAG: HAD family hydrolase [Gammaproteobacteria bacterium]|nr:HAD family hydrolase [Gammaproteobacteria bacterium]|tara:strand:- start:5373 stop:6044 length:672 start_codon:yes stop_codon:yes gene_type:complete
MKPHIYFDLDGTLTDSYEGISNCILYAVNELGFPHPTNDFLRHCIGPPLHETLPMLVGKDLTAEALNLYRKRFEDVGWLENKPYDGIYEALESINNKNYELFVATSKPRIMAQRIIDYFKMTPYFKRIFGSEFDGTHSSKVDLLRFAIKENTNTSDRIMIGDRKYDLIGAISNNMKPIGVNYGYGSIEELSEAGAISIIERPADLEETIKRVLNKKITSIDIR